MTENKFDTSAFISGYMDATGDEPSYEVVVSAAIEQLQKENEELKADLRTSDLNRQSLWVDSVKMADEINTLQSKLKIVVEAIDKYTGINYAPKLEEALSEIGGEI